MSDMVETTAYFVRFFFQITSGLKILAKSITILHDVSAGIAQKEENVLHIYFISLSQARYCSRYPDFFLLLL